MNHLEILLPFGLPPAEMANDLLRALRAPALASLVARTKSHSRETHDAFSRALPHESWFAKQFGFEDEMHRRGSPPVAATAMKACNLTENTGIWFLLQPVHLHIARDHLVLTNQRQLNLSDTESRALFDTAKPLFDEIGKPLLYGDAHTWFVRADDWDDLRTATPDAASGHNIDIWLPQGPAERDWRKLQNEIQMHWHEHAVNESRASCGEKPVNSVWLWGGAAASTETPAIPYSALFNLGGWMNAVGRASAASVKIGTADEIITAGPGHALIVLDHLIEAALGADWSEWIGRLHELESSWFSPLLSALKNGKIDQVSLVMTDSTELAQFISGNYSHRKFWIKPSLSRLAQ